MTDDVARIARFMKAEVAIKAADGQVIDLDSRRDR
jgi:hypothetical protein